MRNLKILVLGLIMVMSQQGYGQNWLTDFDMARQIAGDDQKNILLVFAGSDWCGPCIKLERSIWESDEFKNYAKDNYVLLKADFPRKKANRLSDDQQAHNDRLAERYNRNGYFPLVLMLDSTGKVLGSTGYKNVSPKEYIKLLNTFEG